MSKKRDIEELRTDIRSCFKVSSSLDEKYANRCREIEGHIAGINSDMKLLTSTLSSVSKSLDVFVTKFEEHDVEEMNKYEEIKTQQGKFIKVFWVATGSISTIIAVGGLIAWLVQIIIDLKGLQ